MFAVVASRPGRSLRPDFIGENLVPLAKAKKISCIVLCFAHALSVLSPPMFSNCHACSWTRHVKVQNLGSLKLHSMASG
jgi:hypothetical protein